MPTTFGSDRPATTLAAVHKSGDYLTHEKIRRWASLQRSVDYRHRDFLFSPGEWKGVSWADVRETSGVASTLVVGHSDQTISEDDIRKIFDGTGYQAVFGCNLAPEAAAIDGVYDLPLGIPNRDRSTPTHRIQGSARPLKNAWKKISAPELGAQPTLYVNFSPVTHKESRGAVLEMASSLANCLIGDYEQSRRGRARDFNNMRASGLVVAPRGNGVDTHRIWEALLTGAIPVVLAGERTAKILDDLALPHIALGSWDLLQDWSSLSAIYSDLLKGQWDFSPVTAGFWKQRLLNSVIYPPADNSP